jgi:uncharacterized protein YegJ (DUF2314 family)
VLVSATAAAAPTAPPPRAVALHVLYFAPAPLVPLEQALPFCTASAGGTPVVSPRTQDDRANASIAVARYPGDRAPHLDDAIIERSGVQVSAADRAAVARSVDPIIVRSSAPLADATRSLHDTDRFLTCLAESMQALIWDDGAKILYGRTGFRQLRLAAWTDDRLPLAAEVSIRQVPHGDSLRTVTLGLGKLGLPDVVAENHPQFLAQDMLALVNQVAAAIVDDPRALRAGKVTLNGVAVPLAAAKREAGDPENRLVALALGDATHQAAALARISGAKPEKEVTADNDDPELVAIQKKAQARLAALSYELRPEPPAGTLLAVKAQFTAEDGRVEWMWVEVKRWDKDKMTGVLTNEPFYVKTLHEGDKVSVDQGQTADYIFKRRGAKPEGGDSDRVIEARTRATK